ncbi:gliding motility associated protein GldN [Cesiribacter andamanensis AMV16]|uniref:Gliding motility associated protein GldN n=2 Tax=Cesiribacter TaxID=1133570 RepID=M7N968_9BACT|nr:gliding motility associated protein GldN [Cesiribacter andamanensis AMV16]
MFLAGASPAIAQERASEYNENSVRPIRESDILLKKRVWRRIDLKEKQNKPFFAYNNEISKIMIEAVKAGVLTPYANDSLKTRMSREDFLANLQMPDTGGGLTEEEKAMGFSQENNSGWDTSGWGSNNNSGAAGNNAGASSGASSASATEFLPRQITTLELMEDMIFDKRRSRLYWDIQAVKLVIPASQFETGLLREVAVFKYKDVEQLFRSMPGEAIWFNPHNSAGHLNLADAFTLRLFSGRIIKVANPDDSMLVDIYNRSNKDGLMASQWIEMQLLELEHELWEF